MNEQKMSLSKWLGVLLYIHMASMVITLVNVASNLDSITGWLSKALSAVAIWSMFQLQAVNPRYQTTAIAKGIVLICGLLTAPVNTSALGLSSILLLVGSTASWVASYQEYHAHGELVAEADEKLAKQWNGLFTWEILIGLGISLISVIGTTVMVAAGILSGTVTTVIIALSSLFSMVVDGLYLYYMNRTKTLIETEA